MKTRTMHQIALVVALALIPAIADAQTKIKSGFNLFSPEQDVEIGQQSAAQADTQLPLVTNRNVNAFVNDIGQQLAAAAPGPRFQYQFRVVDASDINAFALPGGFIYLNRGILESAKNEGEVAGVLAHEIAHVALRHGTHNASKAYLTQAGIGILGGLLGGKMGGNTAQIINAVGGIGLNALFLKYSREAEKDADVLGAQILAKSGYSPGDMVSFFQTLAKSDKRRTANWMSSHPAPENRLARIEKEARLLQVSPAPTTSRAALADIQSTLRSMPAARGSQQVASGTAPPATGSRRSRGSARGGVSVEAPSSQTRMYTSRSGVYALRAPANWEIVGESGLGVTIAPRGGVAEVNGNPEVFYGVIVNHYEPFFDDNVGSAMSRGESIDDATNDLIAQIRRASPHLKVVRGSGRRFTLAGGTGLGAVLRGTSPTTGAAERITVITRMLADGHLIYVLFITPESQASAYAPVLDTILSSLRVNEHSH